MITRKGGHVTSTPACPCLIPRRPERAAQKDPKRDIVRSTGSQDTGQTWSYKTVPPEFRDHFFPKQHVADGQSEAESRYSRAIPVEFREYFPDPSHWSPRLQRRSRSQRRDHADMHYASDHGRDSEQPCFQEEGF
uniref:Uncharacterized protein n=1 Tax=Kwoniella bestiolae CBS 10118 TaxID=1296100 RepID=A0A1B9GFG6_9TREE|nr:hypothetical protein I302_01307 [Kwoniella bestiolae CBS 10118]OCF29794.1 hypothetical protein I302_01307 [Kwoniella bestiolae CBS 10118]